MNTLHIRHHGLLPRPGACSRRPAAADWLLRAAVLSHCAAMFAIVFSTRQTQFGNLLFMHYGLEYETAVAIEKVTVSIYLAAGLLTLFYPCGPVLAAIAGYAFLEAFSRFFLGGDRFSEFALAAQSLRYTVPLALLALVGFRCRRGNWDVWRIPAGNLLLRAGTAAVFFMHGMYCWWQSPRFVDLLIGNGVNLLGIRIEENTALGIMQWIAVLDLIVAAAILLHPVRPVLLWAAFWGLITALSRVTNLGPGEYHEVLIRASHFLAPLALGCLIYDPRRFVIWRKRSN